MIITIDGPAGTGKSSVAKKVAQALDFDYFDTGALYRCFTLFILDLKIEPSDHKKVIDLIPKFKFEISGHFPHLIYTIGGVDVTDRIRSFEVNQYVSIVSAYAEVRQALILYQRVYSQDKDCVFEGRDLGSVVFPHADLKVFLTASAEVRAKRRYKELVESNVKPLPAYEEILDQINLRDRIDSTRKVAPLKCPEGALFIDTSALTLDQVVNLVIEEKKRFPGQTNQRS
jgi:cytidylate kinase